MISVTEAKTIIAEHLTTLSPELTEITEATGLITSSPIHSPVDLPPFHQSAMDGYAFSYALCDLTKPLQIIGEVPAGEVFKETGLTQHAVRIFTGAALPEGTDTVIIQEKTRRDGQLLYLEDATILAGANVRRRGSHTLSNAIALPSGAMVTAAATGFLASMGITHISVFPKPKVGILVTGNELVLPGNPLPAGSIYESNSHTLVAALHPYGIVPSVIRCRDDEATITQHLLGLLQQNDLVLITGGISVGDYDFVLPALHNCGAEIRFHKVRQKPGKPLCFSTCGNKPVFALPGNPASVLTCFYAYVVPAIRSMMSLPESPSSKTLPISADYDKKNGMTHFLKGHFTEKQVTPLSGQESYRLDTFAHANCLIILHEHQEMVKKGEPVEVLPILNPYY